MPKTFFLIASLFVVMVLCAPSGAPAAEPNGLGTYAYREMGNYPTRDAMLNLAVDSGANWIREEFNWSWIQPSQGEYDATRLAQYDALVDAARARGLNVLGVIAYGTDWATGGQGPHRQEHYEAFAEYVRFLVDRYRGRVTHWQIWNEPNQSRFWEPAPSAENYAQLLSHAYQAAKSVDGGVTIVGMGTAGVDLEYMDQVLKSGGGAHLDVVAVQPYPTPSSLEGSDYYALIAGLRDLMAAYDAVKPIWITEIGHSLYGGHEGVSADKQARFLARDYLSARQLGVERVFWYDLRDDGDDPGNREHRFGLTDRSLNPRPSYSALQTLTRVVGAAELAANHTHGARWALEFAHGDGSRVLALWYTATDGSSPSEWATVRLPGSVDEVVGLTGGAVNHSYDGQNLEVPVSGSVVYVRGNFSFGGFSSEPAGEGGIGEVGDTTIPGDGRTINDLINQARDWVEDNISEEQRDALEDAADKVGDAAQDVKETIEDKTGTDLDEVVDDIKDAWDSLW